jgi:hypothetical protein
MHFDDIRQQATIDLARFIPPSHFLLRGHTPQAYSEIVEPLLRGPLGLTRRELAAAKAIASWVTFEEINREIFGTLATDFGDDHKEMSTEEDLKTAALEHIARNAAHVYAKHVGDRLLVEAWPLSVWMPDTNVATAMQVAPAKVHVTAAQVDVSLLATRSELIGAFGKFTDMDASWFDNLKDTPALLRARKVVGLGGRNSTEPLFCPYEVMQWLIGPRRKKSRPMNMETGWRMLKHHFPAAYTPRSSYDPNNSD